MLMGTVGFFTGASAVALLFALRLLIGAAEAPSFPGNSRITSAWFPTAERGTAAAIFNSAQYFATVLFAPLMGWLVHTYGWQSVFLVMGGLGVIIAFVWQKTIYGPKDHPRINAAELAYILQATGSFAGALVFVGANAAVAIFCDLFIVGEIKRVELAPSNEPLEANLLPRAAAPFAKNGALI